MFGGVRLFTDDPDVIDLFCRSFWLDCIFLICSHLQLGIHQGILTPFGQQRYTAFNTIWSCLLVGIPMVISTIFFTDLGLIGILLGWTITKFLLLTTGLWKICWIEIDNEIEKSRLRAAESTYGSLDVRETNAKSEELADEQERREQDNLTQCNLTQTYTVQSYSAKITREIKIVLFSFLLAGILFFMLAGVSFFKEVFKE